MAAATTIKPDTEGGPDAKGRPDAEGSNRLLPEWRRAAGLVAYPDASAAMEARVAAIRDEGARELVWLLEHPPLYTAGTSARAAVQASGSIRSR